MPVSNPYIGYAERQYAYWLEEHPIESWKDQYDGPVIQLSFLIDEEILTQIYEERKHENHTTKF